MSLPNEVSPLLFAQKEYEIARSLRFNSADSAFLNRTPGSASNRNTWTWSCWVKRCSIDSNHCILSVGSAGNANDFFYIDLGVSNYFRVQILTGGVERLNLQSSQVFRDVSAWYHLVFHLDLDNATQADRFKMYVNGNRITSFSTNTNSLSNSLSIQVNNNVLHRIGNNTVVAGDYFNGYMAEINFIDGQALTPSSFGETSPTTGVWIPKGYTGTYGTNGFYLSFANNASTTTLGYDDAGGIAGSGAGSNDWTLNNFSVTAGVGNDSLTDSPTNNYAIVNNIDKGAAVSLLNGGLQVSTATNTSVHARTTFSMKGLKIYYEATVTSISTSLLLGIGDKDASLTSFAASGQAYWYANTGNKYNNASLSAYGATFTANDVIGIEFDGVNGTITCYKNGVSQGVMFSGLDVTKDWFPFFHCNSSAFYWNFGQRAFIYTPSSGFTSLCSQNISAPIIKPSSFMNTVTWTGNGNTRSITGVGFQPDLVWSKSRSNAETHKLVDSTRGATKALSSETTGDEVTESGITSFDADGFTIDGATDTGYNTNTYTYVGWTWKKGVTPGFDIVTYTGNGSARTISHSLGAVPHFMIVKARTTAGTDQGWPVYHRNNTTAPETDYLLLNSTAATADLDTIWNDTAPTSSVFSVGTNALVNTNNDTYLAYLWTEITGFSRFGSYTGNGSTDGPFIWCGFRPRWILFKYIGGSANWFIRDTVRRTFNVNNHSLYPSLSDAEASDGSGVDILSNGFKMRGVSTGVNGASETIIFAAFAETPFKYSRAR